MKGDGYYGLEPLDWLDWAQDRGITPACRGTETDLFFPEWVGNEATHANYYRQVDAAKAICRRCPLLRPCRSWALRQPHYHLHGVWGGTTQSERKAHAGEKTA